MNDGKRHYTVVKNKLCNIVRDEGDGMIINQAVVAVHRIVVHTMQLIKLYFLSSSEVPKVDHHFVMCCMRVVRESKMDGRTKQPEEYQRLADFFNTQYKPTMSGESGECMKMKNLTQILDYAATQIVTEYETNVKQHFVEYVERFINVLFDKKEKWKDLDGAGRAELARQLRAYKTLILENRRDGVPEDLACHLAHILPSCLNTPGANPMHELARNPQAFLPSMVYLMRFVEAKGEPTMSVFPCRTSIVPKYITFDTASLIGLLLKEADRQGKTLKYYNERVRQEQEFLWGLYFNTGMRCFASRNKVYQFNYIIQTDGIGCSILLVRKDVAGMRCQPKQTVGQDKEPLPWTAQV